MHCNFLVLLGCITFAGCAALSKHDQLCGQIVQFANGSVADKEHSVQFTTDWGGVHSLEQNIFAEKRCEHESFEPGKRLCDYLMNNTSMEFAALNINRALRCIGAPEIPNPIQAELQHAAVKFESDKVRGVSKGVVVGVEYTYGYQDKPPLLKISARRT